MSVNQQGMPRPVTAVAWTSNSSTCPKDFTLINITEDGVAANFTRFGIKSGYYLCYSKDLAGGVVVTDIQIITDKEAIPHGYCYIPEHLDSKAAVSKRKRVCVRVTPVGSVDTAVLEIKLTARNKMMLQYYTYVGDINGYVLWCSKGQFSAPPPQTKPRSVSLDLHRLSLEQVNPPSLLKPSNPPPRLLPGRISQRRHSLNPGSDSVQHFDGSLQGITALDGVPFSLHPDFNTQSDGMLSSQMNDIYIKSLKEIENEYSYTFAVEESAARRNRPSVFSGSSFSAQ
ncbi:multivesicular body subunit 12A [Oryzias latipes]|uniref:Multivesicular body subunit 12A n=1 Tax=Oryzias latipes TaxID=8090 RepID=H2MJJ2_ORYLA|nr:multivesicular body subunit 12A [Oryzias latipes]